MKDFFKKWWQLLLGLSLGYAIGSLLIVWWKIDYKMVLDYLKVFISLPMALLVIFFGILAAYKEDFRKLIRDIKSAKGPGFEVTIGPDAPRLQADALEATVSVLKESVIQSTEEGPERDKRMLGVSTATEEVRKKLEEIFENRLSIPGTPPTTLPVGLDEVRRQVQPIVDSMMPGFRVVPVALGGDIAKERRLWPGKRDLVVLEVLSKRPDLVALYGPDIVPRAVDSAFLRYLVSSPGKTHED